MIRKIKWFFQRLIRGYSDSDIWNLDTFIVKKIRKPLKAYIRHQEKEGMSLPATFDKDPTAWLLTLSKIEFAFDEVYEDKTWLDGKLTKEERLEIDKRVVEGFELFGKYFQHLWD
jgi:hypothetical protein